MHRRGAAPPQNSSKSRPRWTAAATSRFNKKRKKAQQFLRHAQQITPQADPQDKLWQINYIVILVIADYLFSPFCMVPSLSTSWQREKKSSRYTINKTVIKLWWLRTQTMRNRRRKEKKKQHSKRRTLGLAEQQAVIYHDTRRLWVRSPGPREPPLWWFRPGLEFLKRFKLINKRYRNMIACGFRGPRGARSANKTNLNTSARRKKLPGINCEHEEFSCLPFLFEKIKEKITRSELFRPQNGG